MPRVPALKPNEIYDALKELHFVDPNGELLPWGDDVWRQAFDALQGKMSKDYIYLYLSTNRNDVFRRLHGEALDTSQAASITNDQTADDSRDDLNWSMGETKCVLPPLRQPIKIARSEWDGLKSHIAAYKGREYEVFMIGWTDTVYDVIWSHLSLPCPFAFKNAHLNHNPGEIFLSIKGHCSECKADIHIYCVNEPTGDGPVTLNVSTFDSRGVAHEKKRQVRGENRIRIGKQLQGTSVYAWRRDEANRLMSFGDVEPANLPSDEVARKIKQEAMDKKLGLHKVKEALAAVWEMKYSAEFSGSIHEIGLDKFYVMYWTPTQLYMFNKFMKEDDLCSISIDATGSLVKQIVNPAGARRVVYLYQVVCSYRGKILPLFQWLSEKHDTNTLTYCIREWLRLGGSCPKQVVTDYSLALLNAVSLGFNNSDLKTYVENCIVFDRSSSRIQVRRPRTLIRIDIAHLIKLVAGWKCLKHESSDKKDFYIRCVGLLSSCTKLDDFIDLCTDIVTIAFATHEDIDDRTSRCFAAQSRVMKRLKSYDLPVDTPKEGENPEENPDSPECFDENDTQTLESGSAIDSILKKIEADSSNDLKQGRLNPYYCAEFGSRLLKLSKHFVLWTAVMASDESVEKTTLSLVASSARSEEYFRELKHLILRKGKAIRLDKFLVIHLRSLEGTNKLLNAPNKERETKKDKETEKPEKALSVRRVIHSGGEKSPELEDMSIDSRGYSDIFPVVQSESSASNRLLNNLSPPKGVSVSDTMESVNAVDDLLQPISINSSVQSEIHNLENSTGDPSDVSSQSKDATVNSNAHDTSYLNEYEGWKLGRVIKPPEPKILKAKKRGKYLTVCPDIEIIHKRPKFATAIPLLLNGSSLKPVKIRSKQVIRVKNTCAFDSTVQTILTGSHDYATYAEYLASCSIEIFEFVQRLSTTGVTAALYSERGYILSTTKEINNGELDCTINVSYLQEKYILRDVPSLVRTVRCADCQFEVAKTLPVLHLDPVSLHQRGMAGLQEALEKTYTCRSTTTCFKCKSCKITKSLSGGNHLMINIEDVGNPLLAARNGYPLCRRTFTLAEIPDELFYDGYTYKFLSAIVYTAGHYFAYIKRVTGKWEVHNDLHQRVAAATARILLQQHNIHELFYIRVSRIENL